MSGVKLLTGDCLEELKKFDDDSIDAMVTDPPAGISFMGKDWDSNKGGRDAWVCWLTDVMKECKRVLKPGAHAFVWAIPRTSHWTASALEYAGFEVRDVITHIFGSGFPKSLDVSKAIDKAAGAKREVVGGYKLTGKARILKGNNYDGDYEGKELETEFKITTPSTPEAKQWSGWGTALKPASEHWILVRKPLGEKTVASNVLKHGCGGLNIDKSRIGTNDNLNGGAYAKNGTVRDDQWGTHSKNSFRRDKGLEYQQPTGRWPSNLVLSHNDDCVEVGTKKVKGGSGWSQTGSKESDNTSMSGKNYSRAPKPDSYLVNPDGTETVAAWECSEGCAVAMLDKQSGKLKFSYATNVVHKERQSDSGGASRFFYCAKSSKSERNEGCEGLPKISQGAYGEFAGDGRGRQTEHQPTQNFHPTVKPLKLMSYLITMITPPNGRVLDPFMGSGSTGVAAVKSGFKFIGIEQNPEYTQIAEKRIFHAMPKFKKQHGK